MSAVPAVDVICGDALEELTKLPGESVHCVVTSPPYWGLRDYGVVGQLGLEADPTEYVAEMVSVFREVRRVLRQDGTLWLNMGDCYATGAGKVGDCPGGGERGQRWKGHTGLHTTENSGLHRYRIAAMGPVTQPNRMPVAGLKPKDLVGMPWRVAFALQADGWYLRSDIIWHKPNPMPESVQDRPTRAHEYLFLLSKSRRYQYDAAAIAEPADGRAHSRGRGVNPKAQKMPGGWDSGPGRHDSRVGRHRPRPKQNASWSSSVTRLVKLRNKRSVWTLATRPYPEAHFATFPDTLVEPCILAGCPADGTVLDCFAGSGTTLAVALELGRSAIGIELSPLYVELIHKRLATVQMPLPASEEAS